MGRTRHPCCCAAASSRPARRPLRCVSVDGVDWIIDEPTPRRYLFTTYGRTPAVEVLVDNDEVSGTTAIADLSPAVSVIAAERQCTNLDDLAE